MSGQCKCGSRAINDDPDRLLCDRCWRDAEIERLQKALKSADGQNASLWKNLFDTEAEISRLKEERTLRPGDTGRREGLKTSRADQIKRWREIVDLGILSVGREWNEEHCRCDVDTGCAPCYYCAEHAAILVGEQMLDKIERDALWNSASIRLTNAAMEGEMSDDDVQCPECLALFVVVWHNSIYTTRGPEFCPFCGVEMNYVSASAAGGER